MRGSRLNGRTALVTGAGRGIGRAIAQRLGAEGAWVACLDMDAEGAAETVAALGGHGAALVADIGDEAAVQQVVADVRAQRGGLDVLVNNAGIAGPQHPVGDTDLAEWERTLQVNLTGTFLLAKHCVDLLRASRGCIVNIASALALVGWPDECAYGPSKAGVVQLTKGMALDYAPAIRVNAVCPGAVRTPMIESVIAEGEREQLLAEYGQIHPLHGRLAEPEEIADAVLFLASDDAAFITGVALPVDAGLTAT